MSVNIFDALKAISIGNTTFFEKLSDADCKSLSPYVLLLWSKHPDNHIKERLIFSNEICNPFMFSLSKHPRLLYALLCQSNGFGYCRYSFAKHATDKRLSLISEYMNVSSQKAKEILPRLSHKALMEMANELDWSKKQIKELE
jgi:hypothetical protein